MHPSPINYVHIIYSFALQEMNKAPQHEIIAEAKCMQLK